MIMQKLKRNKGFSTVMTSVCVIVVLLIGTAIFELIRVNIIAGTIRNKYEDAIIAAAVSQYAAMYQPIREGQASTHTYQGSRWIECNSNTRQQIRNYLNDAMSNGEIAQCTIKSIDFTATPASRNNAASDEDRYAVDGTIVVEIPFDFAWGGMTPMEFTLEVKSQWRAKF